MIVSRMSSWVWLFVSLVLAQTSFGDERSVQVTVNDQRNQAIAGVEVQLERLDGKGQAQTSRADASGHVVFRNVAAGTYKVSAFTKRLAAATAVDTTKQNTNITLSMAPISRQAGAKRKRYVYIAGETGTHIGGGRWVAVEDDASGTGSSAVDKRSGRMLTDPSTAPHLFTPPGR